MPWMGKATCEAVQRPSMRFVPSKSIEQQGLLAIRGWPYMTPSVFCIGRVDALVRNTALSLVSIISRLFCNKHRKNERRSQGGE